MKFALRASAALVVATFGLSACDSEPAAPAAADTDAMEGITVTDARLILPAVAGNPGAVYFTVKNDSTTDTGIRNASVQGAESAMLHTTNEGEMVDVMVAPLPQGGELKFEPGSYHVMAMGLDPALAAGGSTEVTINFQNGKKANFPAEIRAAGDDR